MADSDIIVTLHLIIPFISMVLSQCQTSQLQKDVSFTHESNFSIYTTFKLFRAEIRDAEIRQG
jgi:hypothetical protein